MTHPYARELGDFLRARRDRLHPHDVGLEPGGRRKVTGLRREELAMLAGLSTDYYQRMEQGREVRPSDDVLDALAGALGLDDAERRHLFTLARAARRPVPARVERASISHAAQRPSHRTKVGALPWLARAGRGRAVANVPACARRAHGRRASDRRSRVREGCECGRMR